MIPLNPPAPDTLARRAAWEAPAALKFWHLASLDAPTVAVSWACAFAWAADRALPLWAAALLALLVWFIYIADRLLDARAGLVHPSRHFLQHRHYFHWRHRRILATVGAAALLTAGWIVASRLPASALRRDSLMGLATLAYFSGVHSRRPAASWVARLKAVLACLVSRELLVGVLFSAGCVVPVLPLFPASSPAGLYRALLVPAIAFAALAWLNVRAIGRWECGPAHLASSSVFRLALALASGCAVAAVALMDSQPHSAAVLIAAAISALLLAYLDLKREHLEPVTLRALADLVLLTPVLLAPAAQFAR